MSPLGEAFRERLRNEARVLTNGNVDGSAFVGSVVDVALLDEAAAELSRAEKRGEASLAETLCDLALRGDTQRLGALLERVARRRTGRYRGLADYDGRINQCDTSSMGVESDASPSTSVP